MINLFKRGILFIKENPKILYSLLLIIIIPLALFYNTFLSVRKFQENIDSTLRTNVALIEDILGDFVSDFISNPEVLQKKIEKISKENPEIQRLQIAISENGKFKIIAAQNPEEIGREIQGKAIEMAWGQKDAVTHLVFDEEKDERLWQVYKQFEDQNGNKIGVIGMAFSLKQADILIKKTIFWAYLIALLAILVTLFLIIHHTQLFGYVSLSKKLQEADRMKDEFIRMATHELQSPIVNIQNYLLTLEEEIQSFLNEEQKKYFSRIKISSKNLSDLIYDILEVSRIEQERLDFTPQKIPPFQLIEEVVEDFKIKAKQKNLKLIAEKKEKDIYFIEANPNRYKQILTNLIDNAIKYTPRGEIRITTQVDLAQQKYLISIKDTGLGIPASAQQRLFEKFYRVKTRETADIPGTGLGLWITKEICQRMGGKIFVESMEGIGTKFTLFFPLTKS
jgi:signal transduction histidine kinase